MRLAETNGRTVQPSRREDLLQEIAQEEARLQRLEAEQATARARLAAVQAELAALGAEPEIRVRLPLVAEAPVPRTSAEKVKLFRSLFRGRQEVFPTRFVSKKTGKPGYAPACENCARRCAAGAPPSSATAVAVAEEVRCYLCKGKARSGSGVRVQILSRESRMRGGYICERDWVRYSHMFTDEDAAATGGCIFISEEDLCNASTARTRQHVARITGDRSARAARKGSFLWEQ